ncbi:MAG TPA: thioredoxin-disulfide reductase [Candidatus Merdivicinus excrementipullorum]|uniref:Thioredoxin reductase n=1 Tax=Candidatus Merdivicinus excrementipullorum TaxID=2840867 RepID=A0A9D1FLS4_9FIRM|nr:thioredoxin-disulfide reductase [Candidatus Merdivicinus excrementipullorum]
MTDLVIIGAGPAGFSAAIYAVRAGLSVRLLENSLFGGQIINTPDVDNYPGLPGISGAEFAMKLYEHAAKLGVEPETAAVSKAELSGDIKNIFTEKEIIPCRSVIIATGASHRKLGCPGEEEFTGKGVSYCATCDGAFFKGKTVAVNGGGNTALEDALFLSNMCEKVYIIHRREGFRADNANLKAAKARENIEFVLNRTVAQIKGGEKVESVLLSSTTGEPDLELAVDGLFVAIGFHPNTELFEGQLELEGGYIKAGENCRTSIPGVFAAGDVRTKEVRQLITAAADGAVAGVEAGKYLA